MHVEQKKQNSQKKQTIQLEIVRYDHPIQEKSNKRFATKITIGSQKEIRFSSSLNFSETVQTLAKILEREEEESWLYSGVNLCDICGNATAQVLGDADSSVDSPRICVDCGQLQQNCTCKLTGGGFHD